MTWQDQAGKVTRTPCVVVEVDLDWYDDVAIAATNDDGSLCYRTPETTGQAAVPSPTLTTKTRRFMTSTVRGLPELGAIPCLGSWKIQAEEIRVGRGIGYFGQATIQLQDFVDDDRREDPFFADVSRSGLDHSAGTYFGKLIARNPYWSARSLRIIEGWTVNGVWTPGDAIVHNFQVRDIQGPTAGVVTLTAAGPLQLLNLSEVEAPPASRGQLLADITAGATSAALSDLTIADADYPTSGFARIGDEIVAFTRSTGSATLALTRAQKNTLADTHNAGDTVQICTTYSSQNIVDILQDLLVTYGGVSASNIDTAGWATEQTDWLSAYVLSACISKPTKLLDLVQELLEASASMMWWSDLENVLKLRAIRPALTSLADWTDRFHLLKPVQLKRDMTERVSRSDMLIDLRDPTQDAKDAKSYRVRVVGAPDGEGQTEHRSASIKLMFSRWLDITQNGLAARACAQSTMILRDGRITYQVEVAAKDADIQIGDILDVTSRDMVDRNGQPKRTRVIVARREPIQAGSSYRYLLERVPFDGRFAFYTDDPWPDYDTATASQRDPGAFYANAAGDDFGPEDPAYLYG